MAWSGAQGGPDRRSPASTKLTSMPKRGRCGPAASGSRRTGRAGRPRGRRPRPATAARWRWRPCPRRWPGPRPRPRGRRRSPPGRPWSGSRSGCRRSPPAAGGGCGRSARRRRRRRSRSARSGVASGGGSAGQGQAAGMDGTGGEALGHLLLLSLIGGQAISRHPAAALAGQDPGAGSGCPGRGRGPPDRREPPSRATSRVRRPDTSTADSSS